MEPLTAPVNHWDGPQVPPTGGFTPTPAGQPSMAKSRRLWIGLGVLAAVVAGSGTVGYSLGHSAAERQRAEADATAASLAAATADSRISEAYRSCHLLDSGTLEQGDGGDSIIVDTGSKYGSVVGMNCVLSALKTPASIKASIGNTTALMGSRDAEHDGISYSWSYHPDNGVNMVITYQD